MLLAPLPRPRLRQAVDECPVQHVHTTGGADLLALEPGLETSGVEDVTTWKLLAP